MTSKIKELFPEYGHGLIIIHNEKYNLYDIINLREDWALCKIKDCKDNHKDKIQLRLLEEDDFKDIYSDFNDIIENESAERDYRKNIFEVCNPLFNKIDEYIPNETSLVQASDYLYTITGEYLIKDIILPDDFILKYYNGSITLANLYKQFKGKDNFIKIINYIRSKVGYEA